MAQVATKPVAHPAPCDTSEGNNMQGVQKQRGIDQNDTAWAGWRSNWDGIMEEEANTTHIQIPSLGAWYYNFYMSTTLDNKATMLYLGVV